jgi:hypothetical protein
MTKSNLKALNAYFRAKSLAYFFLRNQQLYVKSKRWKNCFDYLRV